LGWFERTGFTFVHSIPNVGFFKSFSEKEKLFSPNPQGNWLDEFFFNARLFFTGSKEGGFFLMIGKKNIL
jgi:hypothetical protein